MVQSSNSDKRVITVSNFKKRNNIKHYAPSEERRRLQEIIKELPLEDFCNCDKTGDILKTKAQALAKLININDFKGSDGWLSHFKHQHHIYSVTKQGESASAPLELLPQYHYDPNDIYNCDETALFWQLEPSKTLAHGETSDGEDSIELELQNIINEYYIESQPVEDYINHECKYEAEGMPSLEEVVA
ncbi:3201_t:CDS:2 [Entrophospora sp. SA101]|nr:3201_t:CDS:2 [Entrophospora sp. SA101]